MVDEYVAEHESDATVRGFVVLSTEQVVWLSELRRSEAPEHQFRLGGARYSDLLIGGNPEVADTHCLLVWSLEHLEVRDYAPDKLTLFNGLAVDGFVQMRGGDVLTIGSEKQLLHRPEQLTHIMAFHRSPDESPKIPVRNFPEYVVKTREYLGDNHARAARMLQLSETTYKRKLKKFSAVSSVICAAAIGGFWLSSSYSERATEDASTQAQQPVTMAPAASLTPQTVSKQAASVPVSKPSEPDTEDKQLEDLSSEATSKLKRKKSSKLKREKPTSKLKREKPTSKLKREKPTSKKKRREQADNDNMKPPIDESRQNKSFRETPHGRGVSSHSPIGARGVSSRDVRGEHGSNR